MKIIATREKIKRDHESWTITHLKGVEFCCDKMRNLLINEKCSIYCIDENFENPTITIYYGSEKEIDTYFCPFCGSEHKGKEYKKGRVRK